MQMESSQAKVALSIIIPVYRETDSLVPIYERFAASARPGESFEIIYVNDGNVNNEVYHAVEKLRGLPNARVIHLSRNFGQHIAIAAGLKNSRGAYALVMDADLQYLPEDGYKMYRWAVEEKRSAVLSVLGKRRADSLKKRLASKFFYWLMKHLGAPQRNDIGSMFLVSRHVAHGILGINDRNRLTIPMIYWLSGDISYFEVSHQERSSGVSGYTWLRSLKLLLSGVTSFSAKPLYLSFGLAFFYGAVSLAITAYFLYQKIFLGHEFVTGWLSTILVILVSATFILACLGIAGLYVGRIFESVNGRPLYFVQEREREESAKLFEDRNGI